jgi:uroporphyrinogen III methyltransferase/synthase
VTGRPIVVTRPGAAGASLVDALRQAGQDALWLPAFEIGPAPDEALVRTTLAGLAKFDLAVFVSPTAVDAVAVHMDGAWPAATAIGAVGEATRRAILSRLPGAHAARVIAPAGADEEADAGGSEALWATLQAQAVAPRRVLILRGQSGREWLSDRLLAAGASVVAVAAYVRRPVPLAEPHRRRLAQWREAGPAPALVFSSSEGVEPVLAQLDACCDPQWLRSGVALASHPRIAARLDAVGFATVRVVPLQADAIRSAVSAQ